MSPSPSEFPPAGAQTAPPAITFVIPVKNGARFIPGCLDHIAAAMRPGDQILVVDNGSSDDTVALARARAGVEVLECPGITIAALRNAGAARARHEMLAFIDADCLICPEWRPAVERVMADRDVSATGSYYDLPEHPTWVEAAWWSFRPRHEHRTTFIISGNLVIRRSAFDAVGGFDATLVTDEDSDLSRRLVEAGYVLVEAPTVRVIHLGNAKTLGQFWRKERWHATSIMATMAAHGIDRPMLMTFGFMVCAVLAIVLGPLVAFGAWPGVPRWLGPAGALALCLAAPAATALLRVLRYRNYRFVAPLVVLHTVVLLVRSGIVLRHVVGRGPATAAT